MKVTKNKTDKLSIIGENVFFNNGVITAFYIVPLVNYEVLNEDGRDSSISKLENLINSLSNKKNGIQFSISSLTKVIKAKDVANNLIDTVRLYNPEYDIPDEFKSNIRDQYITYCLLGININPDDHTDIEHTSFAEVMKQTANQIANKIFSLQNVTVNHNKILAIEKSIFEVISNYCTRASRELVFYRFVSTLYPCHTISYDSNSYLREENFDKVVGMVSQTMEDKFGYFVMHNEGIDLFGYPIQDTYGSIINIHSFPEIIETSNFNLPVSRNVVLQVNCKTLKKEDALLLFKRQRASDRFEADNMTDETEGEAYERIYESINLAESAIREIEDGKTFSKFGASILIQGKTKEEVLARKQQVITELAERNIFASISLNQVQDFIQNFLKCNPNDLGNVAEIRYPLSFKVNEGNTVGDEGSKFASLPIGVSF